MKIVLTYFLFSIPMILLSQIELNSEDCFPRFYSSIDTTLYFKDFSIKKIEYYNKEGVKLVTQRYHQNGNLESCSGFLKNRSSYKKMMYWFDNGNKDAVFNLDQKHNFTGNSNYSWYEDGKVKSHIVAKNDSIIKTNFDTNGFIIRKSLSIGIELIYEEFICPNGFVKIIENYRVYDSNFVQYYCDGSIEVKAQRNRNNVFIGPFKYFSRKGVVLEEGFYRIHSGYNSLKEGKWIYRDETGKTIREEFYENGRLIEKKTLRM